MKKTVILLFLFSISLQLHAKQFNDSIPQHLINLPFPDFKILLIDSVTNYYSANLSKKKNIILLSFSPDCEHCKHLTEEIAKNIKSFKGTQIIMMTTFPFEKMKQFYSEMSISKYKDIIMGRDVLFFFPRYYHNQSLPGVAVYNQKRKFIDFFDGTLKIEELIHLIKK
jgi:thioredoxin-related protein